MNGVGSKVDACSTLGSHGTNGSHSTYCLHSTYGSLGTYGTYVASSRDSLDSAVDDNGANVEDYGATWKNRTW